MPVLWMLPMSIADDSRSIADDSRSIIDDSRSLIDDTRSIIDDSRGITYHHKWCSKYSRGIIYGHNIFIIKATALVLPPGGRNWQLIYSNYCQFFQTPSHLTKHAQICINKLNRYINKEVLVWAWNFNPLVFSYQNFCILISVDWFLQTNRSTD